MYLFTTTIIFMIRAMTTMTLIIKLAVVPSIVIAFAITAIILAASEDADRWLAFFLLGEVIQDGGANKYVKKSHGIDTLRVKHSHC